MIFTIVIFHQSIWKHWKNSWLKSTNSRHFVYILSLVPVVSLISCAAFLLSAPCLHSHSQVYLRVTLPIWSFILALFFVPLTSGMVACVVEVIGALVSDDEDQWPESSFWVSQLPSCRKACLVPFQPHCSLTHAILIIPYVYLYNLSEYFQQRGSFEGSECYLYENSLRTYLIVDSFRPR